jgi:hypothetical protein
VKAYSYIFYIGIFFLVKEMVMKEKVKGIVMSEKIKGCWVAFEDDFSREEADSIMDAIRHLRGVAAVEENVVNSQDWLARMQVKSKIKDDLKEFFERL